jgi:hypothetical protein
MGRLARFGLKVPLAWLEPTASAAGQPTWAHTYRNIDYDTSGTDGTDSDDTAEICMDTCMDDKHNGYEFANDKSGMISRANRKDDNTELNDLSEKDGIEFDITDYEDNMIWTTPTTGTPKLAADPAPKFPPPWSQADVLLCQEYLKKVDQLLSKGGRPTRSDMQAFEEANERLEAAGHPDYQWI